jgi:predicted enzyme related to lactoylglutathione lyase
VGKPNKALQRTAAAMLVHWSSLSLSAAAAAELFRSASRHLGIAQMKVNGLNWVVTCTPKFDEMAAFCRDVLGLAVKSEGTPITDRRFPRYVQFELIDGNVVEVLDAGASIHESFVGPIAQFHVDDVSAARHEMEQKGVVFLGPTFHSEGEGWAYFRAPDGYVYLIGGPYIEPGRTSRCT